VIAAHACSYGLVLRERFLPALLDFAWRYRTFYAVFRFPAWGRGGPRSTGPFDRQVEVCRALGVGFGSFGDLLPDASA
jgi:hypothetical protein